MDGPGAFRSADGNVYEDDTRPVSGRGEAEPLLPKLPQELLNKIVIAIAADEDVLIPRHLGSLARSCRGINEAVRDAKDQLRVEY